MKNHSLLDAIKPKISPKAYKQLVKEIEWRENMQRLKSIGFNEESEEE